ncbi:MAG: response regulator transcription factor [Candidatus Planktophila sp.]
MLALSELMSTTNNLLLVEDDADDRADVKLHLESMSFSVYDTPSASEAKQAFGKRDYSLVLIHLSHDPLQSLALCRWIRAASNVPILMMTSREEVVDETMVIKAGADDYVSKPIDLKILTSRISQQLKRGQAKRSPLSEVLTWRSLQMDVNKHSFYIDAQNVELTNTEFQFLHLLLESPERIFSRNEILSAIGVSKGIGTDHIVDSHASRIRSKIREHGGPEVISVIRSVGFRLSDPQLLEV